MASYSYTFNSGDGVTPTRLNAARTVSDIVNADIKSDAAIAGTKITPDFGSQTVSTTGAGAFGVITATGATASLTVSDSADNVAAAIYSDNSGHMVVDAFAANDSTSKKAVYLNKYGGDVLVGSGNVGISTASPTGKLGIAVSTGRSIGSAWDDKSVLIGSPGQFSGNLGLSFDTTNGSTIESAAPGVAAYPMRVVGSQVQLFTSNTERMRIDGSGNVGIATTSTKAGGYLNVLEGITVHANTGQESYLQLFNNNAGADLKTWRMGGIGNGRFSIETVNDAYSASNERFTITAAGNIGIATATPSYKLHVNGSVAGVGAYNDVSDAREKKNISYVFQHGLQTVRELKPAHFDYLGDGPQNNLGFIAQDIQQVLPGMVTTFNKTVGEGDEATTEERLAIKEANLIAVLVKAVQELDLKVSALEAAQ